MFHWDLEVALSSTSPPWGATAVYAAKIGGGHGLSQATRGRLRIELPIGTQARQPLQGFLNRAPSPTTPARYSEVTPRK